MPVVQPAISIGLPVYNGEGFLSRAVESVLSQTYENLELIVSDNASTDGTDQVCREAAASDRRVRYTRQARNVGVTRNYVACVNAATAPLFKWIAADDYLDPRFVEALIPAACQPGVAISTSRMPYADEEGNLLAPDHSGWVTTPYGESVEWVAFPKGLSDSNGRVRFREFLRHGRGNLFAELYYGIYPRQLVASLVPPGFHIGTEKSLVAAALLAGRVEHVPQDLMFRGMHPGHFGGRTRTEMLRGLNPDRAMPLWLSPIDQVLGYVRQVLRVPGAPTGERFAALGSIVARAISPSILARFVQPGPANYVGRES